MDQNNLTKSLNNLVEYLFDSHNGYKECADKVADEKMKNLFNSLSESRRPMINELKNEVRSLGEAPTEGGSATAVAHRLFIDLKSLVTGGDTDAIVNEVKRGENTTIERYKELLREQLPANLQQLLTRHLNTIENNLKTIDAFSTSSVPVM